MPVGAGIGIAGLATAGATAYAASSQPDAPAAPNYAAANKAAIDADISTLPLRRAIEASAKLGKPITYTDPQTGQTQTFDFTGLGDADTSRENADKMASAILEIQKKYGADFIRQANEQLKLADPQGTAARETLNNEIMARLAQPVASPVADTLEQQLVKELQAGADVDRDVMTEVDQYLVGQQLERGGSYGKADEFQRAMNMGRVAEDRRTARQQKGMGFLTAGLSKSDRDYRKNQQDMANLASFLSGTTPTAQFGQLSGAQNAAAPFVAGAPGPTLNPNAGPMGAQYAQGVWQTQANNAAQQGNPWLQGLGLGLQGLGTVASVGGQQGFGWWGGARQPAGGLMGGWAGVGGRGQV